MQKTHDTLPADICIQSVEPRNRQIAAFGGSIINAIKKSTSIGDATPAELCTELRAAWISSYRPQNRT